jgi:hypothetical protein
MPKCESCPSPRCRYYLRGGRCVLDVDEPVSIPAIAAELGVSEATVKRLLEQGIEKYAAAMHDLDPNYFSTAKAFLCEPVIPDRIKASRRAPRVASPVLACGPGDARGALSDGDPMKINPTFLCMIAELKCERNITAAHEQRLDAAAVTGDPMRFNAELERVRAEAPEHDAGSEPDAFEIHKRNPHLTQLMRWTRVEAGPAKDGATAPERPITADDIRRYGLRARRVEILPNLQALADATDARGDRMGTGK